MSSPLSGVMVSGGPGCHGRIDRADDPALPPAVLITVHDDAPPGVLREVCAGAEEQGIPTAILSGPPSDADDAGRHAAGESRLEVGVGIGPDGAVVVRHALVPAAVLVLDGGSPPSRVRAAGADAARIVAGLALRAM
ncbi:glycerol dehydratase reactivase beta/small subunit family protein [Actinomycetospora endophytica]|uniref:Glycerol dehydratase reactivase beta/small subunit family protein n=1 Tax=Actinomycetospora endophytica TaxID=2291215 RepID=A0ABS8P6R6_9PSEU|nr:glycerol dehydratase reactivase beta/small subunit family protein [Actinomycetospora endophytica]MCD2193947.1 glycerol dehydratase reactivase beta/small subunit family protein [Actinomycetospora endophytica]